MAKKPTAKTRKAKEAVVEDATVLEDVSAEIQPETPAVEIQEPPVEIQDESENVSEPTTEEIVPTQDRERSSGGFIPLVIGGILAGGIGYVVGIYQSSLTESQSAQNATAILELEKSVQSIPDQVNLSPLQADITAVNNELQTANSNFVTSFSALNERIDAVEKQPASDGTLQGVAMAAYQRDIDALRAQIVAQQEELQSMMNATTAQLQATRNEANAIEQRAVESAKFAQVRSALSQIQAALESGAPITGLLGEFEAASGEPSPAALDAISDGVPTLSNLIAEYPDVARDALKVARSEGQSGEESGGISAFLRDQLSVRSTLPQEGDSADAILSRAEAALSSGRLNETLSEISSLPEVSRSAMTEWIAKAELRSDAVDVASSLFIKYNTN